MERYVMASHVQPLPIGQALRRGHIAALEQLEDHDAYRETLAAYEQHLGPNSVYLRPTNKGLVVLSLDHGTCPTMIGVGAVGSSQHLLTRLPPSPDFVARGVEGAGYTRAEQTRAAQTG